MKNLAFILVACFLFLCANVSAQSFKSNVAPLVQTSCMDCHDADTETRLNFESLGYDLTNSETFRQWEQIFDRVRNGEMPPKKTHDPILNSLNWHSVH